ncbi:hypothetical protein RE428_01010 [Marinobacter nanhaiticus D15-8W]|uniref:STAS domain-containing protein n=1 Tax=Marinobacter nanhaiticus D15-8W TaxID=626887 RepID=N6VYA0_9GAMM|nr:STAS domain-containing protein [Marinobacter nanhaiticus]ENO15215.1 STAS domain-containing protein [Marinobacter nanhaiticus D15-8W]BES69083.1 hypothetical protein RE428_01010 [Marinobacter nanhaiticus D15-8W]
MNGSARFDADKGCLVIEGELTIYQASEVSEALRNAFDTGKLRHIDLSGVTELDTAGLQLLLLAKRLRTPRDEAIEVLNYSQPVWDMLSLAGVAPKAELLPAMESQR